MFQSQVSFTDPGRSVTLCALKPRGAWLTRMRWSKIDREDKMSGILSSWRLKSLTSASALMLCCVSAASAQETKWPTHPVDIYVGFAPGGYADTVSRIIGAALSKKLGQPFVVQNIGGAGGNIAARQVATKPGDGYSILATTTALAINTTLYKSKGFTPGGLIPVAIPAFAPEALTASTKSNIKSLRDLAGAAKSKKLYLATPGIGSGSQIAQTYFFQKLVKLPITQIPFSGGGPAMQGVLTGDANLLAATAAAQIVSAIKGNQIVGLAVASEKRDPAIPNVPTFAEQGYPNFLASSWVGFFASPGTPHAIVVKLNKAINEIVKEPSIQKTFKHIGAQASIKSAAQTQKDFNDDVARWSTMVTKIGLSL